MESLSPICYNMLWAMSHTVDLQEIWSENLGKPKNTDGPWTTLLIWIYQHRCSVHCECLPSTKPRKAEVVLNQLLKTTTTTKSWPLFSGGSPTVYVWWEQLALWKEIIWPWSILTERLDLSASVIHCLLTVFFPVPGERVNTNLEVVINMTLLTFPPKYMHGALFLLNG